jgi:predicted transcriptional regulator
MAGKRKQMSSLQKQLAISLFEDGVNQRRIAEILEESQSSVSNF